LTFQLVPFSVCGIPESWRHGHGDMDMETWKHRDIDIETWKHGEIETWRIETWKHGDIKTWKQGHGDMNAKT
jgi:hypothetical protein